jgi:crossover junction endodeoxyribonuclease RuvC
LSDNSHIILGLDPGSRNTGYALLKRTGNRFESLEFGVIKSQNLDDHADRLKRIYDEVKKLIHRFSPDQCAVETPVYGKDPLAMLKLGRAQAACIMAIVNAGLGVTEYYPKAVKKSITGNGNAAKEQVAYMLSKLLNADLENISDDATDALAVAWCHAMRGENPGNTHESPLKRTGRGRTAWGDFVADNPERIK